MIIIMMMKMLLIIIYAASLAAHSVFASATHGKAMTRVKRVVPGFGMLDRLFMPPTHFYPDPGFVRFWGGGYRPVATGTFYGAPIIVRGTSGYLQAALGGTQNYMISQALGHMDEHMQPEYVK
uniref:Uncharacterized protein n=1 Tax=Trichuris muris TaxID=70415 RepID=A0A5S6R3X1_TRIMR